MWCSRGAFLGMLLLAGCGFAPAYAPLGTAARLQDAVRADDPGDKLGFDLVGRIEERLGRAEAARYALGYRIATRSIGTGITPENDITRYQVAGSVAWTLTDIATGAEVASGSVANFTAYSATGSTVATLAAQRDAETRLMRILADGIVTRLVASPGLAP